MRKIIKIILINITVIIFLLLILEIISFCYTQYLQFDNLQKNNIPLENFNIKYKFKMIPYKEYYDSEIHSSFRKPIGTEYNKKPILIFGCSYAYGLDLKDNETFSYKLSKYTKRPVYNRGICGGSIQHSILQAQDDTFYKEIKEPEYIIFVQQTRWQLLRLFMYNFLIWDDILYPRFEVNNNDLKQIEDIPYFSGLYIIKILYFIRQNLIFKNQFCDKNIDFLLLHFLKLKSEIHKHWKNTKFVVLFYYQDREPKEFDNKLKEKLEENDFIVLNTEELTGIKLYGKEYQLSETDQHPNAKAWDIVVPKLAEKLKL